MNYFVKGFAYVSTACFCLCGVGSQALASPFEINSASGLFTPSFRGDSNATWFGWGPGSFDGTTDDELIDSPPQTLNAVDPPAGYNLVQNSTDDVLSGSNNIYSAGFSLDLTLSVPTSGTLGSGFTTLILQGRTIFGGYPTGDGGTDISFAAVSGVNPTYVQGTNTAGQGQFWVKYELPDNAASYTVNIPSSSTVVSIAELQVDTFWSASGYAADTAIVPEPATFAMMAIGMIPLLWRCRNGRQR